MKLNLLKSFRIGMMATVMMATFFVTACGSSEEKPAETSTATPAADSTAPAEDSVVMDSASTRPVVTPNTPPPAQQ